MNYKTFNGHETKVFNVIFFYANVKTLKSVSYVVYVHCHLTGIIEIPHVVFRLAV
jgi:hypothetical protein